MRVYKIAERHELYESKFFLDRLQVSPTSLKSEWKTMTEEERSEFALAFSAKPTLNSGDEEILNHLIEFGSTTVLCSIALLAVRQSNKENAFRFLTQQVQRGHKPLVNFYQALELLNDRRAVPILRQAFHRYKARFANGDFDSSDLGDYLRCCKALLAMEGNAEYERAISEFRSHSDEQISGIARRLLDENKK
jgi:hypothetical protein